MRCSAADTHLKLLDCFVCGPSFLTEGVFECDLAHRRSVSVLGMKYGIRCYPMHPLYGALPEPYLTVRVTRGPVIAHRGTLMRLAIPHDFDSLVIISVEINLVTLYSMVYSYSIPF